MASRRGDVVLISDAVEPHPAYHRFGMWSPEEHERGQVRTTCGVIVHLRRGSRLRARDADLFARPCKRCFPLKVALLDHTTNNPQETS